MSKRIRTGVLAYLLLPVAIIARGQKPTGNSTSQTKGHHKTAPIKVQFGVASFYANKFEGRKTYTDEIFMQEKLTGASNTLPMHTWVRVTNLRNHRTVIVRINDKMHPRNKRLIDLSHAAAKKLGYTGRGLTKVRIDVLGKKKPAEAEEESLTKDNRTK
ncbi:MAG TPA: septal ring lytic transglycosylase RlpA family protein [Puia sp.]|nr:septal ring lytic transglycosylase RlpA family protein [Puia sp.]